MTNIFKNKKVRKWTVFIIVTLAFNLGFTLYNKYKKEHYYEGIIQEAKLVMNNIDAPHLIGIDVKFINDYKTIVYEYKAKSQEAYLMLKEHEQEFTNSVFEAMCPTALSLKEGIEMEYRYYYDDLNQPFILIQLRQSLCEQLNS